MAGTSLLALIDDIATTLDDVAILTKVAAKKTSGVLGDDLALNAQQVAGVASEREIPVVLAVAKGSAINKLILVPTALLISATLPWLIIPLLMIGGSYLCFEGFEKIYEKLFPHSSKEKIDENIKIENVAEFEKEKIKGAVRTDFILSAEIVVITLGTVAQENLLRQTIVLSGVSVLMTFGVYGLVGAIVKLDDLGFYLNAKKSSWKQKIGTGLLKFAPLLMKFLGIAGTVAMFLVGGGIITHYIDFLHHLIDGLNPLAAVGADLTLGLLTGFAVFAGLKLFQIIKTAFRH